jgi:hypothetical protein
MKPTVHVLGIHVPGHKIVLTSRPDEALQKDYITSPLDGYSGRATDNSYDQLAYIEHHSWHFVDACASFRNVDRDVRQPVNFANPRKSPVTSILNSVLPGTHEFFALRLLRRRFPARSWEQLRSHDGQLY